MNDPLKTFEDDLAKWKPAGLSNQQRRQLHSRIAGQLAQSRPERPVRQAFHWQQWLAWGTAASAIALVFLASAQWSTPFKTVTREVVAFSNSWEVEVVRLWDSPICSNVRLNQSFESISFSNLSQAILPVRKSTIKI